MNLVAHTLRAEGHDARVPLVAHALTATATATATGRLDPNGETFIPCGPLQAHSQKHGHAMTTQQAAESGHLIAFAQNQRDEVRGLCGLAGAIAAEPGMKQQTFVAYQCHGSNVGPMGTLRKGNGDVSGGVPFCIQERAVNENPDAGPQGKGWKEDEAFTLEAKHHTQAVAFQAKYFSGRDGQGGRPGPLAPTLTSANSEGSDGEISVAMTGDIKPAGTMEFMRRASGVRRLTPRECERLQGFPDEWTRYSDGGAEISDSARYRMLGNAIAVPVAEWIMRRIFNQEQR